MITMVGNSHGARTVAENFKSWSVDSREKETEPGLLFWNLKAHP